MTALPAVPTRPMSRQVVGQASRLPRGIVSPADSPLQARAGETPTPLVLPGEPLLQHKYLELIRKHDGKALAALFAEFTGVHFHIAWTPALPRQWDARTLPTGCSVCCRLTGSPLFPACRTCGPRQLARALSADGDGHRFTCRLGVRNYWIPIQVRDQMLGLAYLQALENGTARRLGRKRPTRAAQARLRRADAKVMSRLEFARAARFLRHIVQHVESATLSDLRKADLTSAARAVLALEREQARLHQALQRHRPPALPVIRSSKPESHPERIVRGMMDYIERDYARPITLQQCATKFGMNAAYLSNLFSHAVGVPFKTYLTELRLQKARELLSDPNRNVSEVADAVGYASDNRFRISFKKAIGLSPSTWRETFCAQDRSFSPG